MDFCKSAKAIPTSITNTSWLVLRVYELPAAAWDRDEYNLPSTSVRR